ncbi:MAG: ABC transporter permease [Acidobacteria bacterium]|nr:ABC transporter permease [Acidobacteriota bacterium]
MSLFSWIFQIIVVTSLNLRTITQRLGSSAVAIIGTAGVVAVFVAVLSMAEGFRATMAGTGAPDTVVVMRSGADSEMTSILTRENIRVIEDTAGIARSPEGPLASAELFVIVDIPKRSTGTPANVPMRGVSPAAFRVRDRIRMVEGRRFETGRNEVIVGRGAAAQFAGLSVGSELKFGENRWRVVGVFDAGNTVPDSEIWCDAEVLGPAYRRGNTRQTVLARLTSPDAFQAFKDRLTTDPRVNLKVMREQDYYAEQSIFIHTLITGLGTLIAGLMAIGAIFGAVNTMYSSVAARTREIATLRALGFRGGPVVISVLVEAALLGLVGGAIGAAIAYVGFNGYRTSTINWQSFSQLTFAFRVTPQLLGRGVGLALGLGLIGGLFPAIRAARLPVVTALREL